MSSQEVSNECTRCTGVTGVVAGLPGFQPGAVSLRADSHKNLRGKNRHGDSGRLFATIILVVRHTGMTNIRP